VQLTPTQVRSEMDDALEAIKLHLLVNQAVSTNDVVNNSIIAKMASSATPADFDTFDNTNESLEAIGDAV